MGFVLIPNNVYAEIFAETGAVKRFFFTSSFVKPTSLDQS